MILVLFWFLISQPSPAAEESPATENTPDYTQRIRQIIDEVKDLGTEMYVNKVDGYRQVIEKYIDHKKRVCNGEFSTIVLSDQGEDGGSNKAVARLSGEERKLCFREMKALQIAYINNMFVARKRYLDYLHVQRIDELTKARDQSIKILQTGFSKEENKR